MTKELKLEYAGIFKIGIDFHTPTSETQAAPAYFTAGFQVSALQQDACEPPVAALRILSSAKILFLLIKAYDICRRISKWERSDACHKLFS